VSASDLIAPLASSVIGGVVVALVSHFMTKRREHEKKLAELRIEHLIECWRKIERAALVGDEASQESKNDAYDGIEDAIARITLLGTAQEVEMAQSVTVKLSKNNPEAVVELLNELRSNLRRELGLKALPKMENVFFRVHRDKK
jgi:hypothetical protein